MPESEDNETEIKTRPTTRWDWKVLPMPRRTQAVRIDHRYTAEEMDRIRLGFWPQLMEEKWFVFWEDPYLYLHRSWTGLLFFRVRFEVEPPGYRGRVCSFQFFAYEHPSQSEKLHSVDTTPLLAQGSSEHLLSRPRSSSSFRSCLTSDAGVLKSPSP